MIGFARLDGTSELAKLQMKANPMTREVPALVSQAFDFASKLHHGQTRKGTQIPYLSHLMAVASLVMEYGGTEQQVIAALLHDSLEDQADHFPGGEEALREAICVTFSSEVLNLVTACTNAGKTGTWRDRKQSYLDHLALIKPDAHLIVCADKLHNARCILRDLRSLGDGIWDRFSGDKNDVLWYYRSLADILCGRMATDLEKEFEETVAAIESFKPMPSDASNHTVETMLELDTSPVRLEGNIIARLAKVPGGVCAERWDGQSWVKSGASPVEVSWKGVKLSPKELIDLGII